MKLPLFTAYPNRWSRTGRLHTQGRSMTSLSACGKVFMNMERGVQVDKLYPNLCKKCRDLVK